MEQIERIRAMEARLDAARSAVLMLEQALETYQDAKSSIRALGDYLASDAWREDFAADEAHRLPADLRRGVLSEDGIYNLLEADAALRETMAALAAPDSETGKNEMPAADSGS